MMLFPGSIIADQAQEIPNRLIDYVRFQNQVAEVAELRKYRRVSEDQFIAMAEDPETIVLDARSERRFALLHVAGARHLNLSDFTEAELQNIIPGKSSRILIYCNNNFLNATAAFPSKAPSASLNIHTMNMLYSYGYHNVYELGPLLDIRSTKIAFAGTQAVGQH